MRDQICTDVDGAHCVFLDMVQATRMTANPFALFKFDGVLGFALSTLSVNKEFNFVHKIMQANPHMPRQLSLFLARDECTNTLTLGGYDEERAADQPRWANVTEPELGYWQVKVHSFKVNKIPLEDFCDSDKDGSDDHCRAVTDLGSTLLVVPSAIYESVQTRLMVFVPEEVFSETLDCREYVNDSISIEFELGEFTLKLKPRDIMSPKPFRMASKVSNVRHLCLARIHHMTFPPPLGPKTFILGHPFLRTYYTMYDWEQKRVGFALAQQKTTHETCIGQHASEPAYIRRLDGSDYYLPHLTGPEEEMEEKLRKYSGKGSRVAQS